MLLKLRIYVKIGLDDYIYLIDYFNKSVLTKQHSDVSLNMHWHYF